MPRRALSGSPLAWRYSRDRWISIAFLLDRGGGRLRLPPLLREVEACSCSCRAFRVSFRKRRTVRDHHRCRRRSLGTSFGWDLVDCMRRRISVLSWWLAHTLRTYAWRSTPFVRQSGCFLLAKVRLTVRGGNTPRQEFLRVAKATHMVNVVRADASGS